MTDYPDPAQFSWPSYLEETGSKAVPAEAFNVREAHSFQPQMKLEAVDKRSPGLIRVATVEEVDTHRIKVHYDGWSNVYDEWVDSDHPDIHPAGWCDATGHPLKIPPRDTKTQQSHVVREPPATGQATFPSSIPCKPISNPRTKYSFHNRIGRPPKYRKNQQRDYQTLNSQSDRTLSLCWEQHCKLLPGVQGIHANQVAVWSVDEVRKRTQFGFSSAVLSILKPDASVLQVFRFVQNLIGCEEQARVFKDEMIDGEAFLLLTQTDIVKIMSIKLGPALKISNAILMFKSTDEGLK
ncbi:hypothetical protein fugu_007526 [Takifugu bimaculatus]|uniref:SAM domain-containing protein n=1 Tax=Takifugu bimaculatus TaxID=433685 RepID=A0A4Z2B6S1_9TELE|nr:hypothetical protein fugu_007526 [Takifugu bimaculatus]